MAPARQPRIVIAVTVERGGFGVDSAAPVAARMLEQFFSVKSVAPVPVSEEEVPSE
jgi:cell division protein FtsI/penicillin-binding protein 2